MKPPTLGFGSGRDLRVTRLSPTSGSAVSTESAWGSLSVGASHSRRRTCSKMNPQKVLKINTHVNRHSEGAGREQTEGTPASQPGVEARVPTGSKGRRNRQPAGRGGRADSPQRERMPPATATQDRPSPRGPGSRAHRTGRWGPVTDPEQARAAQPLPLATHVAAPPPTLERPPAPGRPLRMHMEHR